MPKLLSKCSHKQLQNYKLDCKYLSSLDYITGGFNTGELIVIAARPGQGKTTLQLELACLLQNKGKSLFESLEMTEQELINRSSKFVKLELMNNLWIDCENKSIQDISILVKKEKPKFLFIDYLQIMSGKIKKITSQLKELAKKYKCVIFITSQLNRLAEDQEPKLSMLKDSGAIEQDADQIWFIHNDVVTIAKNRKGMIGSFFIKRLSDKFFIYEDEERETHETEKAILLKQLLNCNSLIKYNKLLKKYNRL